MSDQEIQGVYGKVTAKVSTIRQLSFHDNEKNKDIPYVEVELENPTSFSRTDRYLYASMKYPTYQDLKLDKPEVLAKIRDRVCSLNVELSSRGGKLVCTVLSMPTPIA